MYSIFTLLDINSILLCICNKIIVQLTLSVIKSGGGVTEIPFFSLRPALLLLLIIKMMMKVMVKDNSEMRVPRTLDWWVLILF